MPRWCSNVWNAWTGFMQMFHTLGIYFIPKWAVFIPGAGFSYLFGIIKKVWYEIVWLSTAMIFLHTQIRCFGTIVYCFIFENNFSYHVHPFHTYLVWKKWMRYEIDWITPSQFLGTKPTTKVRFQGPVWTRVCSAWRWPRMLAVEACRVTWYGHQS